MSADAIILRAAWRGALTADNAEAGFARIRVMTGSTMDDADMADAIAGCLSRKLIREPVRLPEGALHCHWTLELAPAGVEAARDILTSAS